MEKITKLKFDTKASPATTTDKINELIKIINEQQEIIERLTQTLAQTVDLMQIHDMLLKNAFPEFTRELSEEEIH
jgi:hypothetical protein